MTIIVLEHFNSTLFQKSGPANNMESIYYVELGHAAYIVLPGIPTNGYGAGLEWEEYE